jgi:GDP-L-fucose synthase
MPTNTFGPNDNYDSLNSHFFPSLIKKIHTIKKNRKNTLILWGDGSPKRELIFVDDVAEACVFFMNKRVKESLINIGTGKDFTIKEYAKLLLNIIYPDKKVLIKLDKTKPNGTPRKVLNINLAKRYGWVAKTDINKAIRITYKDYLAKSS